MNAPSLSPAPTAAADTPLLALSGVGRDFDSGGQRVAILKDIHLEIRAGEMLAIIGPSGSGKSTLMNLIGCLDQPSHGSYRVQGRETREMSADELARLRREHFGFVFQRYQLLAGLSARENVEIPAIYAGAPDHARHERAAHLLRRLGLEERLEHYPSQLSGGQQQRVSIARALMNGGSVILADEPTGALDSHTSEEVMRILQELNAAGHTVILVTHDAKVAAHAQRIVEISDGCITADRPNEHAPAPVATRERDTPPVRNNTGAGMGAALMQLREAARMALHALAAHRMRSLLTMLGIIIGIVSVVLVNALGEGSKQKILANLSSMGTNTISVYPGKGFGDRNSSAITTLNVSDMRAIAAQPYVDSVSPQIQSSVVLRMGNIERTAQISGVGEQYFRVQGYELAEGIGFDAESVRTLALDAVIDDKTRAALFAAHENPLGKIILLGSVPARIIGVTAPKENNFGPPSQNLTIWLPYSTVMGRLTGSQTLQNITVRIRDSAAPSLAEEQITALLKQRHGTQDFFTFNSDSVRNMVEQTTLVMRLFISSIAIISLIVGGIGVMNIMLVSVTERTPEIGIRMAVGARQADIMQQFLIEAVLVCLLGGLLGIALALLLGQVIQQFLSGDFQIVFSSAAIVLAVSCSTLIGLAFGFWPARNAARLNPVEALANQ